MRAGVRLLGLAVLAALWVLVCTPAHAETVIWDEASDGGVPKGVVGNDGIRCIATATAGGDTYTAIRYIGADADEMASNPDRERNWQAEHCRWINSQEVGGVRGWFKWTKGIDIDPSIIKVTIERV